MTGSPQVRPWDTAIAACSGGVWLVGTNGRAHFYPGVMVARAGAHSACHHWTSTTLDSADGDVEDWCEGCLWQIDNGLVGTRMEAQ